MCSSVNYLRWYIRHGRKALFRLHLLFVEKLLTDMGKKEASAYI
jgi:hypothetical protein